MRHLCLDGETVVLKRFAGMRARVDPRPGVRAVVLDTETTGLDPWAEQVIEIGVRPFDFDPATGEVLSVGEGLSQLQDPGRPLPPEVCRITGLSDRDLAGHHIDWRAVAQLIATAELVVAHNARFDRAFVDRALAAEPGLVDPARSIWACTASQVDWDAVHAPSKAQEVLCAWHGFFILQSHRALDDADALLHLLERSGKLAELYAKARRPNYVVKALRSAFDKKDVLKARGYRWNGEERCWWTQVASPDQAAAEKDWAALNVYDGVFRGAVETVEPWQRFAP